MNARRLALTMAAAGALCAYGGPVVTLKNPQTGELASCKGGFVASGMASKRVADDLMIECVDGYVQQGYEVVEAQNTPPLNTVSADAVPPAVASPAAAPADAALPAVAPPDAPQSQ